MYKMVAIHSVAKDGVQAFHLPSEIDLEKETEAREALTSNLVAQSLYAKSVEIRSESDRRPVSHGLRTYGDLFFPRQLVGLSELAIHISSLATEPTVKIALGLLLSETARTNCRLCIYDSRFKKLSPAFSIHSYYVPTRPVEGNLWGAGIGRGGFRANVRKALKAYGLLGGQSSKDQLQPQCHVYLSDALDVPLDAVNANFAVFTDPPYFDNLDYGQLSDFCYQWLHVSLNEINEFKQPHAWAEGDLNTLTKATAGTPQSFEGRLGAILKRLARHGHFQALALHYHHRLPRAWKSLCHALTIAQLRVERLRFYKSELDNGFHTSPNSLKVDAVFYCRHLEKADCKFGIDDICLEVSRVQQKIARNLTVAEITAVSYAGAVALATVECNVSDLDHMANDLRSIIQLRAK
jgi:adenine-specific DNA methylase